MAEWILPSVVSGILVLLAGLFVAMMNNSATANREQIANLNRNIAAVELKSSEVEAKLEAKIDASRVRERIRDDYIYELRDHISNHKPPPPPPWPDGLTR